MWLELHLSDDKSTVFKVMAWCCKAISYYESKCWPRSMSPCGVTGLQLVKWIYSHAMGLVNMTARSKTNIGNQLFCSLHFESFEKKSQKKKTPTYFSESNKLMGMMMWIWMVSKHHLLISRHFFYSFPTFLLYQMYIWQWGGHTATERRNR